MPTVPADQSVVPSHLSGVRESLRVLADGSAALTLRRLWLALTPEDREEGLRSGISGDAKMRRSLARAVADGRHFRLQTVEAWDDAKLCKVGARVELSEHGAVTHAAIVALHIAHRAELLSAFLEAAEIAHDGPQFKDSPSSDDEYSRERLHRAADAVLRQYPVDHVVTYILALCLLWPVAFKPLVQWLQQLAPAQDGGGASVPPLGGATEDEPQVQPPAEVRGFTTLDRRMILLLVGAAGRIDGAPNVDEVDDLVLELLQLNTSRHQSFFHAGYRDALFRRDPGVPTLADNESRRLWYWGGYINGVARRDAWGEIAALFDREVTVRDLGRTTEGAGASAAWLVARALCETGRYGEAAAFATIKAVAVSHDLRSFLLATATKLIRMNRAAEARPMLDVLWAAYRNSNLASREERPHRELARRRALCLRQLGDTQEARRLLDALAQDQEPWVRAAATADLGLINVGVRQLGDLTVPPERSDLDGFIRGLEKGEQDFRRALAITGLQLAHANFALGVLELCRKWQAGSEEATLSFERAYSHFATSPDVYRLDGTLQHCELYLGVAIALELKDAGRLLRACDLIRSALGSGAKLPGWLAAATLEALSLVRSDLARKMASEILTACGDGLLDEISTTAAASGSAAVRAALFHRVADEARPMSARVADSRTLLPWLLTAGELEEAASVLEYLEGAAIQGVGQPELVELLSSPIGYSPAWEPDRAAEARLRILEAQGAFDEAAAELEAWCHRILASEEATALDHGMLMMQLLEEFGPAGRAGRERLQPIVDARMAARDREYDPALAVAPVPLRILVVGGDERQAKNDESIRAAVTAASPNVDLNFLHSGWSSNWSAYVAEFERKVADADGVVLLAYMRTEFGRAVRARCHVPWRGCPRGGQNLIARTIAAVIPMAANHKMRRASGATGMAS